MTEPNLDEIREQLEEFAISLKPGTTKGKHRTAIFDTVELAKLVQALIAIQVENQMIAYQEQLLADYKEDIANQVREARIDQLTELDTFLVNGTTIFGLSEHDWNDKIATLNGVKNK